METAHEMYLVNVGSTVKKTYPYRTYCAPSVSTDTGPCKETYVGFK